MATEGQRVGVSSMDLWQLCRLYRCEKCAGQAIASYADGEHEECFIFFSKISANIFLSESLFKRYFRKLWEDAQMIMKDIFSKVNVTMVGLSATMGMMKIRITHFALAWEPPRVKLG